MWGEGVPPHNKPFLDTSQVSETTNQILKLFTQRPHQISQVFGLRECYMAVFIPSSLTSDITHGPQAVTCASDQLARSEFLKTSSLGSFVTVAHKTQGNPYAYYFIKGYDEVYESPTR